MPEPAQTESAPTESGPTETVHLPPAPPPANHGHTVAAWIAMAGVMLGAAVIALAVALTSIVVFCVGAGVILASLVIGGILRNMGYGQKQLTS